MIGVFSKHWTEPLAQVLKNLGAERVWVVHGSDGLDEITTSGPTSVAALEDGHIKTFEIAPEELGLHKVKPEALRGGDAETNAKAVLDVLKGKPVGVSRRRASECGGGFGGRRQGERPQGWRCMRPPIRSIAARPRGGSTG